MSNNGKVCKVRRYGETVSITGKGVESYSADEKEEVQEDTFKYICCLKSHGREAETAPFENGLELLGLTQFKIDETIDDLMASLEIRN